MNDETKEIKKDEERLARWNKKYKAGAFSRSARGQFYDQLYVKSARKMNLDELEKRLR